METQKHLYRSRQNRILAGVCGGIAEYYSTDPAIIRLIAIALTLAGGSGVLAYIIAWIIIPEAPATNPTEAQMPNHTNKPADETKEDAPAVTGHDAPKDRERHRHEASPQGRMIGGLALIAVGAIFLIQQVVDVNVWRYAWPLVLIVLGLVLLTRRG